MENSNNKEVINFNDFFKIEDNNNIKEYFSSLKSELSVTENIKSNKEEVKEVIKEVKEEIKEEVQLIEEQSNDNYFEIFKDKANDFKFEIFPEGDAKKAQLQGRVILETEDWSLIFNGTIDRGICTIPIKKIDILEEGITGRIKVEVIADDSIFVPWEDDFKIKMSKKVSIKVNETKQINRQQQPSKSSVSINMRK
jgi:hypothetical protein